MNFLYFTLKQIPTWASLEIANQTMPAYFKANYPDIHIILIEQLFIEMSSSFRAQSQTFVIQGPLPRALLVLLLVEF